VSSLHYNTNSVIAAL